VAAIFAGVITLFCQIVYRSIVWGGVWGGGRDRRGNFGLFLLIAMVVGAVGYFLAIVIRMAISRTREYVADAGSVELTHNPDAMISALQKVAGHTHLEAPASMRAMFLEDDDEGIMGLFATHPPIAKRIAALSQYAGGRVSEPRRAPTLTVSAPSPPAAAPPAPPGDNGPWGGRTDEPSGPWS
jgi:heat shock protein HtpX